MEMSQERMIAASRDKVWAALMDPEVLKDCIPGCQELTGNPDDGFEAVVTQKVGPVKATFKGEVKVTDRNEPSSARLEGAGKGGPAGFANGAATLKLEEVAPNQTKLSYDVEASVGGKLAQLGGRIIDAFAKKLADQFFQKFQDCVESGAPVETAEPELTKASVVEKPTVEVAAVPQGTEHAVGTTAAPQGEVRTEVQEKKGLLARLFGR